jgi:hypothetical protein
MNETVRPNRYIAETFIAAYYLSDFFSEAQRRVSLFERHILFGSSVVVGIPSMLYGVACLIVAVGILLRARWAKLSALILSSAFVI